MPDPNVESHHLYYSITIKRNDGVHERGQGFYIGGHGVGSHGIPVWGIGVLLEKIYEIQRSNL